ncbi:hypothetical protein CPC735_053190 [Coccidioides posadasii C735 delta SOWgp]|uniref:C2H2-type domain-containing protein n=1 Tax=Coccidioides posadasii (strain C735) TaxID=222929 RepID=C5PHE6_COCP7|nr:hypothetical protein CPC735_053190 [Coccidioides posadasii C735 delta SOWgp]EER23949.1 hypothetical protein CPC735_053190 [Coccidioides posadasii C735 delta SOWgp]|eukprot:XP_003066094.1 hypothetical protein CPC735_053190 [Coccidioides posadasii C735 delta SOWgp]
MCWTIGPLEMIQVQIPGSNLLALPLRFPISAQEDLGMTLRNSLPEKDYISRNRSRVAERGQRASLSPSTLQNLRLSSRTPPSHAISSSSQQGSPVMSSVYLSHPTTGTTQGQRDLSQFHIMTAKIATNPSHQFETEFRASPSYEGFYNTTMSQPALDDADHFRYEVTPPSTGYEQALYDIQSRSSLWDYGTDNLSVYSGRSYGDGLPETMAQCSEAMDLRPSSIASSHPFESSGFTLQQLHFVPEQAHLAPGTSVSSPQLHQSSHGQLRQSPLFANTPTSDEYPRTPSSNPPLSSNNVEIPPSSLASQYSSSISSIPILSSAQPYEPSPFYTSESLSDSGYSLPPSASTTPVPTVSDPATGASIQVRVVNSRTKPQCWDHGCNGREFSTFSNLLRHQREKAGLAAKSECPYCGAVFTRTTARNGHLSQGKCKVKRQMDEKERSLTASR